MESYPGEICIVGFNFAPANWALCDGSILKVTQYPELAKVLGSKYGGDGKTTFALPNLQGRVPMGAGQGKGLTTRQLGDSGGAAEVKLETSQLPSHTHQLAMTSRPGDDSTPSGQVMSPQQVYGPRPQSLVQMNSTALSVAGGSTTGAALPHNNMMPYLTMNFIICLKSY